MRFWMKLTRSIGATLLVAGAGLASAGTIVGSPHDFSGQGWSGGQICVPCHTPHKANITVADAPLWNHALTAATFTLYSSPTLNATIAQPGGGSRLCFSCHDGTVAINSFGGATGTTFIGAGDRVGPNLRSEHPIGFTYNDALATADGSLRATTTAVTIGSGTSTRVGTIASNMLFGGNMECASCHDVHNTFTSGGSLLKVQIASSAICTTCHAK